MSVSTVQGGNLALRALTVNGVPITGNATSVEVVVAGTGITVTGTQKFPQVNNAGVLGVTVGPTVLTGTVAYTSANNTVAITSTGNNINFESTGGGSAGVQEVLVGATPLTGNVSFTSSDSSITITTGITNNVDLVAVPPPPTGVQEVVVGATPLTGNVSFTSAGDTINITVGGGNSVNLEANPQPLTGVQDIHVGGTSLVGLVGFTSSGNTINITADGSNNVNLESLGVNNIIANGLLLQGDVGLTSTGGSIVITKVGNNANFESLLTPFSIQGLQNTLGIFSVYPASGSTQSAAANQTPTSTVPDATPPIASTTVSGTPCWLYTKPALLTGFNWYQYNPRFGNPAASLPYRKFGGTTSLKTLWAVIQPVVNIYTAGLLGLNVYTYDDANPPTSGFYNSRFAYSNTAGINSGQTGVNLYANFTYLVYAYDAPRITNQTGVGQPDQQVFGLRDPYDIHTDLNHIPLQNCVIAFNPWTDTTNYRSWTTTGLYTIGQTVVFSGAGTNPNGIFYTATGTVPVNTPPISTTGVASPFWTAISPQPSTYATQPILGMAITGINGATTGWGAGPLIKVLSMGYSVGPDALTTTGSYEITLAA